jgi:hypothetical protein
MTGVHRQALAEEERKDAERRAIDRAKTLKAEEKAERERLMAEATIKDQAKLEAKMHAMYAHSAAWQCAGTRTPGIHACFAFVFDLNTLDPVVIFAMFAHLAVARYVASLSWNSCAACNIHSRTVHGCNIHRCTIHSCTVHSCTVHGCLC